MVRRSDPASKERRNANARVRYAKARDAARLQGLTLNNPRKARGQIKSRCSRLNIEFDLTLEFFNNVPSHCVHCGVSMTGLTQITRATVDRIDPKLGYTMTNCEWLCGGCNRRKNDQSWIELLGFAQRGVDRLSTKPR